MNTHTRQTSRHLTRTAWRTVRVLALLIVSLMSGQIRGDDTLLGKRWREHSYGVSLRPPLGSRLVSQTADDAIVRFYGDSGYTVLVYIKKSGVELTLRDLIPKAIHQLGGVFPSAVILDQKRFEAAGRPGVVIYFRIPDVKRGPWVMAQAFVQLEPRAFVMLQMETDLKHYQPTRKLYEAVLDSVEVQDPQELDRLRTEQIGRGAEWLATINPKRLQNAIRPRQWFRIVDAGADIGYMQIAQETAAEMGQPGLRVTIQSRIILGPKAYDSLSTFFESNNGESELWSIRTTVRPAAAARRNARKGTASWAETGVRSQDKITVSLEKPTGIEKTQWNRPPTGYLSQVKVHMLEQLQTPGDQRDMGFYAYYPNARKVVYRSTRSEPGQDGTYKIYSRSSPEQDEQVTVYRPDGTLLKRTLPGGREILPAKAHDLRIKWKLR